MCFNCVFCLRLEVLALMFRLLLLACLVLHFTLFSAQGQDGLGAAYQWKSFRALGTANSCPVIQEASADDKVQDVKMCRMLFRFGVLHWFTGHATAECVCVVVFVG